MYMDINILDITILSYFILINTTSFESLSILVITVVPLISELWYNNSELFGLLYTLIYVGAVVILFVFILSILNKKEEWEWEYNNFYIILLIILLFDLDIYDYSNNDLNVSKEFNIKNLLYYNNNSEMSILGNELFTEYGLIIVLIGMLLLISIIGLILIVLEREKDEL